MTAADVAACLRRVIDPELGLNVVDLGLIHGIEVSGTSVHVRMTATTPSCPVGPYLAGEVEAAIRLRAPGIETVTVDMVWDPPWSPERLSSAARSQLGWEA